MSPREASIEDHLKQRVDKADGLVLKLVPTGYVGIPDRLVILPGGRVAFVELKRPKGAVIGTLQRWWGRRIGGLGVEHWFLFTREEVDAFMEDKTWETL